MKFGAHVSAAGGLINAPLRASALGLECFQFFSRSPQGGRVSRIGRVEALEFLRACDKADMGEYYIHAPYVINLAAAGSRIRLNSIEILRTELERGTALKATAMMAHVGSARGVGEKQGVKLVIEGIREILDGYKGTTKFLVEISAGAGMVIGDTFEEIRAILDGVGRENVGVCFDTAHAFASGYDLRSAEAVEKTMKTFDEVIGLPRLLVSHCNDSRVGLGERRDRHEHIGKGRIGLDGFEAIVTSAYFREVNLILETSSEGIENDIRILKRLRGMAL